MPSMREYKSTRAFSAKRASALLAAPVLDDTTADADLLPIQKIVRDWRREVLQQDLGGHDQVTATKRALLDLASTSFILACAFDQALLELVAQGKILEVGDTLLAHRNSTVRVFRELCRDIGLERVKREPIDLTSYLSELQAPPPGLASPGKAETPRLRLRQDAEQAG